LIPLVITHAKLRRRQVASKHTYAVTDIGFEFFEIHMKLKGLPQPFLPGLYTLCADQQIQIFSIIP
jgi:hypothetical protein